jgi:hypothetical protein
MSNWTPTKYKTSNWSNYNAALKRRGSLTIWFDPEMIWTPAQIGKRGRQQSFSDAATGVPHDDGADRDATSATKGFELCRKLH